jgi:hypothetical protein
VAPSGSIHLTHYSLDLLLQQGNILLHDIPDPNDVDPQILVNGNIPKARYTSPINFWMQLSQRVRKTLRGLGKDLQVAHDCILGICISKEESFPSSV